MANKVWGGLMMYGGRQHRVIMCGTIKEFRTATGISRDYMSGTGNQAELDAANALPGVLLMAGDDGKFLPYV